MGSGLVEGGAEELGASAAARGDVGGLGGGGRG